MAILSPPAFRPHSIAQDDSVEIEPSDLPHASVAGPAPYRVLVFGGLLLAGRGVSTHELALSGVIARGIGHRMGHGVDVESVIADRASVEAGARALGRRDLRKIDAVVLMFDHIDGPANRPGRPVPLGRLVNDLCQRMTPGASITVVIPSRARSARLPLVAADFEAHVRASVSALTRVVQLGDLPSDLSPVERYSGWGEQISAAVASSLIDPLISFDIPDRPLAQWQDSTPRRSARPRIRALSYEDLTTRPAPRAAAPARSRKRSGTTVAVTLES